MSLQQRMVQSKKVVLVFISNIDSITIKFRQKQTGFDKHRMVVYQFETMLNKTCQVIRFA